MCYPMELHTLYRTRVRSDHEKCLRYSTQQFYSTGSLECAYIIRIRSGEAAFINPITKYPINSSSMHNSYRQQVYPCARIACAPSPNSIPFSTLSLSLAKPSLPFSTFFALAAAACSSLILLSISGYHLSPTS